MWCKDFVSAYCSESVDRLSEYYGDKSMFFETTGDGCWTEPITGAHHIVDRLTELNLMAPGWSADTCQWTRAGGMLIVLVSADGVRRQILIVYRPKKNSSHIVLVSNHFYLTTTAVAVTDIANSFQKRFEDWATSLDRKSLKRYRTAFHAGLTTIRNYYSDLWAGRRGSRWTRWHQYDGEAWFSLSRRSGFSGRVYTGVWPIRKRYHELALDHRRTNLWAFDTCWCAVPEETNTRTAMAVMVLVAGTVPKITSPGIHGTHQEFTQLFVVDGRTQKILNDLLFFDIQHRSVRDTNTIPPLLTTTPSDHDQSTDDDDSSSLKSSSSFSSLNDVRSPDTSDTNESHDDSEIKSRLIADELTALRWRVTATVLKIRTTDTKTSHQQQQSVAENNKLNPRQLFIGCVPLYVKYGQLKMLFERFGEVTYVKVYAGYNKQTGAKMLHNYAFLFFKDEASVEKAIAASPVPLDSNWNLNVSRPHHHTTTAVASTTDRLQ